MKYLILLCSVPFLFGCINSTVTFSPAASANLSLYARGSNLSPAASSQESAETLTEVQTEGGGALDATLTPLQ